MTQRCRKAFPIRMMCRCLRVSVSGYYDWVDRKAGARAQDSLRLLERIRQQHAQSDGVLGSSRIWEDLRYEGECCVRHRVARLMRDAELQGVPPRRQWRKKTSGESVGWMAQSSARGVQRRAAQHQVGHRHHPYPHRRAPAVPVRRAGPVIRDRGGLVDESSPGAVAGAAQAVLMALWQQLERSPVIVHSDRGCQFTPEDYHRFLKGHSLVCSMSAVGSYADNAAAERFFGALKRERVNPRLYRTRKYGASQEVMINPWCWLQPIARIRRAGMQRSRGGGDDETAQEIKYVHEGQAERFR